MDESDGAREATPATFATAAARSADKSSGVPPPRPEPFGTFLAAPTRMFGSATTLFRADNRAFALLIMTTLGLVIIPEAINYLIVKHTPDQLIEKALISAETPIAGLARWAGSGVLLALSLATTLMKGHPNRDISWLLVFLLALNLPYLVGPQKPDPPDLLRILLANAVLVAIWNTGARIAELKWIPIILTGVGAYSLIGGLVVPEYMMYNTTSRKALVAGWELAGPFGKANSLGMYCAIAFSLVPLIPTKRWRVICGSILLATIIASATRTALTAALLVIAWWVICRLRSVISIRLAGTIFASIALGTALCLPLLAWAPEALTGRGAIWAQALQQWQHSPIFGLGFKWFRTYAQWQAEFVVWASGGTGHSNLVDTLVRSGLVGVALLAPIWIGAIFAGRAMPVPSEQIACFGYLIAFFALSATEAMWDLWPNTQQFPTSGLIFATFLLARDRN